ncbi:hypothetical protein GH733_006425, partial [Mirounga leonina]
MGTDRGEARQQVQCDALSHPGRRRAAPNAGYCREAGKEPAGLAAARCRLWSEDRGFAKQERGNCIPPPPTCPHRPPAVPWLPPWPPKSCRLHHCPFHLS